MKTFTEVSEKIHEYSQIVWEWIQIDGAMEGWVQSEETWE